MMLLHYRRPSRTNMNSPVMLMGLMLVALVTFIQIVQQHNQQPQQQQQKNNLLVEATFLTPKTRVCFNSMSGSFQSECVWCDSRLYANTISSCTGQATLAANISQAQAFCIATACLQVSAKYTNKKINNKPSNNPISNILIQPTNQQHRHQHEHHSSPTSLSNILWAPIDSLMAVSSYKINWLNRMIARLRSSWNMSHQHQCHNLNHNVMNDSDHNDH